MSTPQQQPPTNPLQTQQQLPLPAKLTPTEQWGELSETMALFGRIGLTFTVGFGAAAMFAKVMQKNPDRPQELIQNFAKQTLLDSQNDKGESSS